LKKRGKKEKKSHVYIYSSYIFIKEKKERGIRNDIFIRRTEMKTKNKLKCKCDCDTWKSNKRTTKTKRARERERELVRERNESEKKKKKVISNKIKKFRTWIKNKTNKEQKEDRLLK
jgi:hypothetical protein